MPQSTLLKFFNRNNKSQKQSPIPPISPKSTMTETSKPESCTSKTQSSSFTTALTSLKSATLANNNLNFQACKRPKSSTISSNDEFESPKQPKLAKIAQKSNIPSEDTPKGDKSETFAHISFDFLQLANLRDSDQRLSTDPEYDCKTLFVPPKFFAKQTPAMKQWWSLKSDNFDVVLLFKMGKFYETFHMDADICVKELGISYMKGEYAHAGFPEASIWRYSNLLIGRGYKIGRIEQTETPEMLSKRNSAGSAAKDKVVTRELCQLETKGTRREAEGGNSDFLLCFVEEVDLEGNTQVGAAFVDTTVGKFYLSQFTDDRLRSNLRRLNANFPAAHVLFPRSIQGNSEAMNAFLDSIPSVIKDALKPETEMWSPIRTVKELKQGYLDLFSASVKQQLIDDGLNPRKDRDPVLRALGGLVWYLRRSLIDDELLSQGNVCWYQHDDCVNDKQRMIIDAATHENLNICPKEAGTVTLFDVLNHCRTPFGKRLLRTWLCNPPCCPDVINDRLDAIEDFRRDLPLLQSIFSLMSSLPDIERLLSKIHQYGSKRRATCHPDSRAIFFDGDKRSRRCIKDFLLVIQGLKTSRQLITTLTNSLDQFKSRQLISVLTDPEWNRVDQIIDHFKTSYDLDGSESSGTILPFCGVDSKFDGVCQSEIDALTQLDEFLHQQKRRLGTKELSYVGTGRQRYQLEVPDWVVMEDDWELQGRRKGFRRYRNEELVDLVRQLTECEEEKAAVAKDMFRVVLESFDTHYSLWIKSVNCVAVVDVLCSLTYYSLQSPMMTRPSVENVDCSFLHISEGLHPILSRNSDFIANTVSIERNNLVFITGANMGGKSTLMRMAGLIVIMAHLGSFVPAEECRMSPVDRIFTRLGASDRITEGQSTFFVELNETSSILKYSTRDSFVVLDELGRGTATYDGTAIAKAVAAELGRRGCMCLFATHYHSLLRDFPYFPRGYMSCFIDDGEVVTFLYKFVEGSSWSYGFNVARLAGIPNEIVSKARTVSEGINRETLRAGLVKAVLSGRIRGGSQWESLGRYVGGSYV